MPLAFSQRGVEPATPPGGVILEQNKTGPFENFFKHPLCPCLACESPSRNRGHDDRKVLWKVRAYEILQIAFRVARVVREGAKLPVEQLGK